jgi:hypothetical protein
MDKLLTDEFKSIKSKESIIALIDTVFNLEMNFKKTVIDDNFIYLMTTIREFCKEAIEREYEE